MGTRNRTKEILDRLNEKTLEQKFRTEICQGLNCSPFEAEAVLDVVRETYFPILEQQPDLAAPGRISLVLVRDDQPAGKPVACCEKVNVTLRLHRGAEDDRLIAKHGPASFRLARIPEL